jgi:hypothetical protein
MKKEKLGGRGKMSRRFCIFFFLLLGEKKKIKGPGTEHSIFRTKWSDNALLCHAFVCHPNPGSSVSQCLLQPLLMVTLPYGLSQIHRKWPSNVYVHLW